MKCPVCLTDNDRVIDSRSSDDGLSIRRRRECMGCKLRYTTYERIDEYGLKVVKKDHIREPFSREKIFQGLARACWKRPVSDQAIQAIVDEIETEIYDACDFEVDSHYIGELIMRQLRKLDQVAYVRFASVYREFKAASDFEDELQLMKYEVDGEI